MNNIALQPSPIKSFVLRQGRLTRGQQQALTCLWPKYGLDIQKNTLIHPQALFPFAKKFILEIGFGNGESLLQQAQQFPDCGFIGIEVHPPGVGQLLNQIHDDQLNNLKIIQFDAVQVCNQHLQQQAFDKIQVFFPDPWPKKKHHKRRILQTEFVDLLARLIKPHGVLHIATDWADYAKHIQALFNNHVRFKATIPETTADYYSKLLFARPETKFERRGLNLNHEVFDCLKRLQ